MSERRGQIIFMTLRCANTCTTAYQILVVSCTNLIMSDNQKQTFQSQRTMIEGFDHIISLAIICANAYKTEH